MLTQMPTAIKQADERIIGELAVGSSSACMNPTCGCW